MLFIPNSIHNIIICHIVAKWYTTKSPYISCGHCPAPPLTSSPKDSVDNGGATPTEFKANSIASRAVTMGRLTGPPARPRSLP
ncbi:hypothetical protein PS1_009113 [Malus domestica]